jgi:predicted flap endonuclease-1-like 5' DNA nuclease
MGSFGCTVLWLIVAALIGWLLYYWLSKRCCKNNQQTTQAIEKAADTSVNTANTPKENTKQTIAPKKITPKSTTAKPKSTATVVIDLAAAKAAGISIKHADDLTVIEGIGPKISALFKDNGLNTFAQVADATVPQMRAILDKGGPRYRIANPGTWAKQAKLAGSNQWEALKKLQNTLSGGKVK